MAMKSRIVSVISMGLICMVVAFSFTSCGFGTMLYDLIAGGKGDEVPTYTLEVYVRYTGCYEISYETPLLIAAFGYPFEGEEPDLVYMSSPIISKNGSYSFTGLDERSYGILVFIDFDGDAYPSDGDIYQFYNGKSESEGPDELYLVQDESLSIILDDRYTWGYGGLY
jgi:hypothetical protein